MFRPNDENHRLPPFGFPDFNGFHGVYDAENELVGGSMQATYDGLGRCVRRTTSSGALLFTYDGWKPILEWDSVGNWAATNVYGAGADEILARQDSAGHILIYKQDQHGNVVAVLTDNGDVTEKYTYDAFGRPKIFDKWGNERSTGTAVGNRFLFQGREYLAELGIYDYRHRYYQPDLGRFLQTDPMGLQTEGEKLSAGQKALYSPGGAAPEAFSSSEMNLFRYCHNDPINKSDPFGLVPPGDGLMDVKRDTLKDMYDASRKNVNDSNSKPDHDAYGHPTKQEFRRDGYRTSDGQLHQTEPVKGERQAGAPSARDPGNPFGKDAKREYITHSHVTGNGSHYGQDVPSANRAGAISGVGTVLDGGRTMQIFVPSADRALRSLNQGGGFFYTSDGMTLRDGGGNIVPH